nr:11984_t:CDS:2 [Entrophospora candida]
MFLIFEKDLANQLQDSNWQFLQLMLLTGVACEDENEDNELSEVEGNLNNEIREGDEESDNGSNESDTIIELYELDGYEND